MKTTNDDDVLFELGDIQQRITKSETDSIMDRWEFGRLLLTQRSGKQLPRGVRDSVKELFGLESSEITRRMQLAEKFSNAEELTAACERRGGSWRRIIREELTKAARPSNEVAWGERMKWRLDKIKQEAITADHEGDLIDLLEEMLSTLRSELMKVAS
ncbi:hypothetical protein [Mycolicibacter sinensis]|uniref:hypothetical protein n=1 Tax=Mycolicibacter sinensis (strain JDM601) TaxID=875328 RepID=UPI0007E9D864|nr:hypothetical protein [Mycolicibacter sinensis]OBH17060.1 hypothetical protein A5694_04900 [Mycolicibacter sinensis]